MNSHPNNTATPHEEEVDPFEAAEKEGLGLEVLATLAADSSTTTESCAFRLDGQPCKLCGEGDGEDLEEEEKATTTATTNTTTTIPDPYERKKQKAKQSRASLNSALQQLANAMEVVTDDATQRVERLLLLPLPPQKYQHQPHAKCHSKSITDRPKFLAAATSVLLGMNQQCQALEQEVLRLRTQLQQTQPNSTPSSSSSPCAPKRTASCCSGGASQQQQQPNTKKRCCGGS